jgi:hypothetical protein
VAVVKPWARQSGGSHSRNAVSMGGTFVQIGRLRGGPSGFRFFQFIQNWLNFKNQIGCLIILQQFPIFACGYLGIL